jgi:hypothetical protein
VGRLWEGVWSHRFVTCFPGAARGASNEIRWFCDIADRGMGLCFTALNPWILRLLLQGQKVMEAIDLGLWRLLCPCADSSGNRFRGRVLPGERPISVLADTGTKYPMSD